MSANSSLAVAGESALAIIWSGADKSEKSQFPTKREQTDLAMSKKYATGVKIKGTAGDWTDSNGGKR